MEDLNLNTSECVAISVDDLAGYQPQRRQREVCKRQLLSSFEIQHGGRHRARTGTL